MIFRGTDTVAILMEWIMARMVLHPDIQAKAQAELDAVVGRGGGVTDADVANLPYIQCVVKETLRMHPPGPLLSWARLAIHDAHVGGHLVPAGTTAMVNMWAIAHDPAIWAEPEAFRPERFQEEDVSVLGSDLRLAPFGAGRRVCSGKVLALATTHLGIAQLLLHRFEWAPAASTCQSPWICRWRWRRRWCARPSPGSKQPNKLSSTRHHRHRQALQFVCPRVRPTSMHGRVVFFFSWCLALRTS